MISIPITCDVIVRISWKGLSCIQRMNLGAYESAVSKLPREARIDILNFLGNREYGWSSLHGVTVDTVNTVSMNWNTTTFKGVSFYIPSRHKYTLTPFTQDRFIRPISLDEYLLGIAVLPKVKTIRIEQKKKVFNDLGGYLRRKDPDIVPKVFINDKEFDWFSYLNKDNILDYLREFYSNKMDVYLTHLMIRSGFLAPVVFSGVDLSSLICEGRLKVPIDNYWIFYLMYGRSIQIVSELQDGSIFNASEISKLRVHKTYLKEPTAHIHIESKFNKPVVINGLLPMRFRDG